MFSLERVVVIIVLGFTKMAPLEATKWNSQTQSQQKDQLEGKKCSTRRPYECFEESKGTLESFPKE
jgi:hypothetical protein